MNEFAMKYKRKQKMIGNSSPKKIKTKQNEIKILKKKNQNQIKNVHKYYEINFFENLNE